MHNLDLYKSRKHTTITIAGKVYKFPNEYTVEEVERLFELKAKREVIQKEEVISEKEQLSDFWGIVFEQLEILFQHYQPEIMADELKKVVSHDEALKMLGFFDEYRLESNQNGDSDVKKKLN